ncbi:2Fe-2S iron-sulfur cluster-binding protein [Roseibium aggregatum]|nr:2Fe-2S iron-sulfur cluster-binding protein [Roseibium aggregatum]
MKTVFHNLSPDDTPRVRVRFADRELMLRDGANLAAELLAAGVMPFRHTPVSGAPRAPFCMMGACFDCLVLIDGVTRRACMSEVSEGLEIAVPGKADHD